MRFLAKDPFKWSLFTFLIQKNGAVPSGSDTTALITQLVARTQIVRCPDGRIHESEHGFLV